MSFDLTESGLPYFRARYGPYPSAGGTRRQIRGRFEVRMTDPTDPSRSEFSPPADLLFDTGAELTAVSEQFAETHGFGDFRSTGTRANVRGYDEATAYRAAWLVVRWVRFRNWWLQPDADGADVGGIHDFQFRIEFAVVEGAVIRVPILGLIDSHALFQLSNLGDEYLFFPRVDEDGIAPLPDRVREID